MILSLYRPLKYQGMNLLALLMTLTLFSGIFLSINQWLAYQRQSAVKIYQDLQAISIAHNQQQRLFMGLSCQTHIEQNQLIFHLNCHENKVTVRYPTGETNL
ncbi:MULTISPECIES: DUF5374 domain-containing protein [unclassified Avibacterium]|uniref:DUF5374 domain-containing protein n=1 Tax=unclassified Avibacterium TaxID=2685287 RepID=UPI002026FD9C|nr:MULTISPECIES: DUF5374 domain-containing protein [unclassified Avibacterium]URL02398.1 DUF5374 domain-containing protein [Avibacterium sp. 20-126]MCW9698708.1 DUF5374 domain-containing protein [Avibacterium sp. 20-129]MCW9717203.1 DUF5374 domain-containing protein [Avibacterium sp. 21-599]MCW9732520.1 DUF5374 domain-containing protein [Avibacterium sp. 20-15]URL04676.1 DUF5374 domain-containing protein [Avibacterium sp. 20-132]